MNKFWLILMALIVFVGCDPGQKMLVPVIMDDIQGPGAQDLAPTVTEEPTPTNPLDFNVDIPERPVPEGAMILDSNQVYHWTAERLEAHFKEHEDRNDFYGNRIFQSADEAFASEGMHEFSAYIKTLIQATCGPAGSDKIWAVPTFHAAFRSHEEREAFLEILPGKWYTIRDDGTEKWRVYPYPQVWIIDEKDAYYPIFLTPENMCKNFK